MKSRGFTMVVPILKPPAMPVLVFKIAWIAYGRKIATRCRISLNYWCERPRQNAPGEQFHFHPCRDVMGPTCITSTSRHRLMPLDLPLDKSLEEVILAVKNSSAASFSSIYKRKPYLVETDTQLSQPQREILRSSPHPLNFLTSQLPPESYVQELSSRMERCSRNRVIGRARPADYIPPQIPRYQTLPRGTKTAKRNNGDDPNLAADEDVDCRISFLVDKCNSLATRLRQLETQLFIERAEGKKLVYSTSSPTIRSNNTMQHEQRVRASMPGPSFPFSSSRLIAQRASKDDTSVDWPQAKRMRITVKGTVLEGWQYEVVKQPIDDRFEVVTGGMEEFENLINEKAQTLEHQVPAITKMGRFGSTPVSSACFSEVSLPTGETRAQGGEDRSSNTRASLRREDPATKEDRDRPDGCMMAQIFKSWSTVVGANKQREHNVKAFEKRVKNRQRLYLLENVFRELRSQTTEASSSRKLASRELARVERARMRIDLNLSRSVIERLKEAVKFRKVQEVKAKSYFKHRAYRRVMNYWRNWVELKAERFERRVMTGYNTRMGNRYNRNKLAAFTRRRELLLPMFRAWAAKSAQLTTATRMHSRKLSRVAKDAFKRWRVETTKTKQIKKTTPAIRVKNSPCELGESFRMWYIYAEVSRRQSEERERLLRLIRRAKNRKKCHNILRAWRHLALYGRIYGLYTRFQLTKSLAEQKEHNLRLVEKVDELAGKLRKMEELAMESRSQMVVDQREISEHRISFDRQTNALHQPEEESVRLQSLLSPAATVGPCIRVCKAKDFSFKDEELLPLSQAGVEAIKCKEEMGIEALAAGRMQQQETSALGKTYESTGSSQLEELSASIKPYETTHAPLTLPTPLRLQPLVHSTRTVPMKATARVPTADAKIQARLPPDPEAEARAAVAVAALAAGTNPPLLPRELVRLDRVEWVLRRASFVEIISRLKQQQQNLVGNKHQQPSSSTSECSPRRGPGDAGVGGLEEARGVRVDAVSNVRVGASGLCNENRPNGQEAINSSAAADAAITTSVRPSRPSISPADSREEDEESKKDNDDGGGLLGRLVSIFEFLRSGNSLLLPSDLRMEWESRPDLGLGLLAADDHVFYPLRDALSTVSASQSAQAANRALKESQNSSPKGGNWAGGGASGVRSGELSSWNVLCQEQREGGGGPLTYQDLQVMLKSIHGL